ncbi:MAG: hypothetical protein BEU04_01355 [Marine Group III euryarchaeote CG-Bathy1]|uniref:YdbS-like PH domain-containing protein n=1 Tax=Marine Group III euryarchaeote CG-Bathy1 TaxID=1889001 RepID=A0A1J5TSB8_9ARCH|nr:MAG: hypothetical protein BEU04_01355 [Marine Group III euryarchaeote CG-Bathy1]
MAEISFLRGEELKLKAKPHFLSFLHLYAIFGFLILWGFACFKILNAVISQDWLDDHTATAEILTTIWPNAVTLLGIICWSFGLLIFGFLCRYFYLETGGQSVFRFCILVVILGVIGLVLFGKFFADVREDTFNFSKLFLPTLTILLGFAGLFLVNYYRLSFTYFLTNVRIILQSDFFLNRSERQVRYNHIEDIKLSQSIFGRLFGFGTVIPLTGTGLGTGTDEAMLASGLGSGSDKMSLGFMGGLKKTSRTARHDPHDTLYGISKPSHVRDIITENIQSDTGVEHLKRIEKLLDSDGNGVIDALEKSK